MSTTVVDERDLIEAAGRAAIYTLLATGFAWPSPEKTRTLESILLPAVGSLDMPNPLAAAVATVDAATSGDLETLRSAHMSLFPPVTSSDVPGYETAYRGDGIFQQSAMLADIAGFYRAHGLRAGGCERERLDHITVEVEFMALLARKEVSALQTQGPDEVEVCRQTAQSFLRDHLACWAPAFGRRAASISNHRWYQALGELLAVWVEADAAAFGVAPVEVADDPLPQEPPDDGGCGPCPLPTAVSFR
ncbi:MAG: molecular chaperone TorD family protein [Acidobacteria bacterium]|nr:molecular chaperone TorD family protein [Acidobacteriota bacterium]